MKRYQLSLLNTKTNQSIILKTSDSQPDILKLEYALVKALASVSHAQVILELID